MFTTTAKVREDSGLFGLSIAAFRKGDEILVVRSELFVGYWEVASGQFEGVLFDEPSLDFSL